MTREIVKKEVRYSIHISKNESYDRPDLHFIKEHLTYNDGTTEPKAYFVKDYKRNIWVTKEAFRNHKDKKEFEDKEKLNSASTIQSDISIAAANLLGKSYLTNQPDSLKSSPYLYGYDITSTSLIKYSSLKRNEFVQSSYSVAGFDIETDPKTDEIRIVTVVFNGKIHTTILSSYLKNISDPVNKIKKALEHYLPNYTNWEFSVSIQQNEVDLLKNIFKVCNSWKPDFIAIWNMDFDISKIMQCLKRYNVNPVDVICDQSIPRRYRVCRYKQGMKKKVTASGVVKPINPSLQWHTLISTSNFYVIDPMCVYRQLRMAKQEEQSYSLDAILKKELNTQKLKFEEANEYKGEKWHIFMQERYPVEYVVYNIYDCLSMLELDIKTKDLSNTLPAFAGITDFQKFNSQVRKLSDALFLFGIEKNKVIGTVGKIDNKKAEEAEIEDELLDSENEDGEEDVKKYKTLGLSGWIQLLPQNLLINDGLECIEEYPNIKTNLRGLVTDLDCSAAYPSATLCGNVSKETCVNELIKINGIKEEVFREQNLSICLGNVNMLEYFEVMFGLPSITEIDAYLD